MVDTRDVELSSICSRLVPAPSFAQATSSEAWHGEATSVGDEVMVGVDCIERNVFLYQVARLYISSMQRDKRKAAAS